MTNPPPATFHGRAAPTQSPPHGPISCHSHTSAIFSSIFTDEPDPSPAAILQFSKVQMNYSSAQRGTNQIVKDGYNAEFEYAHKDDHEDDDDDSYEYEVKFRIDKVFSSLCHLFCHREFTLFPDSSSKYLKNGIGEFELNFSQHHLVVALSCIKIDRSLQSPKRLHIGLESSSEYGDFSVAQQLLFEISHVFDSCFYAYGGCGSGKVWIYGLLQFFKQVQAAHEDFEDVVLRMLEKLTIVFNTSNSSVQYSLHFRFCLGDSVKLQMPENMLSFICCLVEEQLFHMNCDELQATQTTSRGIEIEHLGLEPLHKIHLDEVCHSSVNSYILLTEIAWNVQFHYAHMEFWYCIINIEDSVLMLRAERTGDDGKSQGISVPVKSLLITDVRDLTDREFVSLEKFLLKCFACGNSIAACSVNLLTLELSREESKCGSIVLYLTISFDEFQTDGMISWGNPSKGDKGGAYSNSSTFGFLSSTWELADSMAQVEAHEFFSCLDVCKLNPINLLLNFLRCGSEKPSKPESAQNHGQYREGDLQKVLKHYPGILDRLHLTLDTCGLDSVTDGDYIDLNKAGFLCNEWTISMLSEGARLRKEKIDERLLFGIFFPRLVWHPGVHSLKWNLNTPPMFCKGIVWDPGTLRTRFILKGAALLRSCHHDRTFDGLREKNSPSSSSWSYTWRIREENRPSSNIYL